MQYPVIAVMLQIISESTNINGVANQVKVIRCRRRFVYELKFCRQISVSTVIVHNQPEISVVAPDIQVIGFICAKLLLILKMPLPSSLSICSCEKPGSFIMVTKVFSTLNLKYCLFRRHLECHRLFCNSGHNSARMQYD